MCTTNGNSLSDINLTNDIQDLEYTPEYYGKVLGFFFLRLQVGIFVMIIVKMCLLGLYFPVLSHYLLMICGVLAIDDLYI